ncbi:hypothetical protein [Glaesserella parasuis]|uniref:hypothetical protein n=1 Tax=Glaesserella parasuis TaxID=738 RepID=UPI002437430D|nr:hypothetical protein [Glaesserella parasuis]MDG6484721.1 hypothetical protein [Glaesserella parasuis]
MKKNTKNNSQYFQADFSLLKSVASKGDFRLLSAMLVLNRFANGIPKTPKEHPFSITYAGAKAISEHLNCRWETGKQLQSELLLNGYISKLRQAKGTLFKINYTTLNINLPVAFVDSINQVSSVIYRINHAENATESEKLNTLMLLLTFYKNLSMSDLGGFNGVFQKWDIEKTHFDITDFLIKLSASNTNKEEAYNSFIQDFLFSQDEVISEENSSLFWKTLQQLKRLGLIYEVIVLLEKQPPKQPKLIFTIRINDYHADNADLSYVSSAMDSSIAYYGNRDFNYDVDELYDEEMSLKNSTTGNKVIRLVIPCHPNREYEILTIYRPRFRFSHPDIALWQKTEDKNISNFIDEVDDNL